jgi:2-polyprenyl-3-methyl-5-hydroxy-6-metoxy-1,4-benzoquinol methylase
MERYFSELATAFVRGRLDNPAASIDDGLAAGLRLHKFKQNQDLARVRRVLSLLRSLVPATLLDIGSGRGTFLWPLLAGFPEVAVTAIDVLDQRIADLNAVRQGGIHRLQVVQMDVCDLTFPDTSFDGVTILEVLEHLQNPEAALGQALRVARRFVIASVPSTPDDNPEHRHLFTVNRLRDMAVAGGCPQPKIEHVLNHRIFICIKP